ncbi:beta-ketoacyl [acyl carrier protein] synthase domain-containing protein [Streptomyces avermitilis]|uniref:beta-ketoacyl [acyl carrier protein] synthase domain-containing protein n=1 Tax=Streptomyces avermitilis TaxID=33903 RepID=UPI0037FAB3DE
MDGTEEFAPEQAGTDHADAIAVIGMGCRFAGADGVQEFLRNLTEGRDCVTRAPKRATFDEQGVARQVAAWGLMPERDRFDRGLVGYTDPLGDHDPQHGLLYETLWAAVEDAGLRISDIGPSTALYAGVARTRPIPRAAFEDVVNSDATFAGPHFSYFHNLQRESVMVDGTCATGLLAVHLASQSLRTGECDYALAGGVAMMDTDGCYEYSPKGIYSPTGYCRPFDRTSDGVIPGDGVGAVLLRRLDDALCDGDSVHAVIRSTTVGNDGHDKAGFTIPGIPGKVRVVRWALDRAGLTGADLGYVEAHGVGIPMNDQIEATALTEALGPDGGELAIGSVKASVGHTDTAAGFAALIKTVLSVREGILFATPNTGGEPIEEMVKGGDRFSILPESRHWPGTGRPRRAGVMSAGFGGINAFAVIEEAVEA